MGRFIECQTALVPWGKKARFRRANVGLMLRDGKVYIGIFTNPVSDTNKLLIDPKTVQVLPAAIRFNELKKDLFIKEAKDEQQLSNMVRAIRIVLRRDQITEPKKISAYENFLSSLPLHDDCRPKALAPLPLTLQHIPKDDQSNADNSYEGDIFLNNHPLCEIQVQTAGSMPANSSLLKRLENKSLKYIVIHNLPELPRSLWARDTLHELTLKNCNLEHVPKQLEALSRTLRTLDLSNNKIKSLPRTFCCKMTNLRTLVLSHNSLETLPLEIKFFSMLLNLHVSNNRLRLLPSTFSDLRSLKNLYVANNNLSQLPAFRRDEIQLRVLDISGNPFDGALNRRDTFEVYPSYDGSLGYDESLYCPLRDSAATKNKFPKLFEICLLRVVRCDKLLKLASEESLPQTIVTTMQREIFKCYKCGRLNVLPAYNSTDFLDYIDHINEVISSGNRIQRMTFMKLLCRDCFGFMRS